MHGDRVRMRNNRASLHDSRAKLRSSRASMRGNRANILSRRTSFFNNRMNFLRAESTRRRVPGRRSGEQMSPDRHCGKTSRFPKRGLTPHKKMGSPEIIPGSPDESVRQTALFQKKF
jgi:hypothetical protein